MGSLIFIFIGIMLLLGAAAAAFDSKFSSGNKTLAEIISEKLCSK